MNMMDRLQTWLIPTLCIAMALTMQPTGAEADSHLDTAQLLELKKGEILVQVRQTGHQQRGWVEAMVLIQVPPETLWPIMTNCNEAPAFVPGLKDCEVLDSGQNWDLIRHIVKWTWFLPKFSYVFRAEYNKYKRIDFERIRGDLREMRGAWHLYPFDHGGQTVLRYEVYLDPGLFVPNWLVRQSLKKTLPALLAALRRQAENNDALRELDK
jgi:ribosome-associated toxin RatA of RatAB toxin-antitoxin module